MMHFYIPHKLIIGDISRLSDKDSIFAIQNNINPEDLVEIETPNGIFLAQITNIEGSSIEIEILEQKESIDFKSNITIIQSISHVTKFSYFLEKITEIGVDSIIPVISEYTIPTEKEIKKEQRLWGKIINDAKEQSRNRSVIQLHKVVKMRDIKPIINSETRLCFATENTNVIPISADLIKSSSITLAFGPESGWSQKDINIFKELNFKFVKLKGNVLRTETAPIVVTSIVKFLINQI